MSQNYRVLAINPGSTSTKIGVFEGEKLVYEGEKLCRILHCTPNEIVRFTDAPER